MRLDLCDGGVIDLLLLFQRGTDTVAKSKEPLGRDKRFDYQVITSNDGE